MKHTMWRHSLRLLTVLVCLWGGTTHATTIFNDTFTGSAATLLTSHTPDTGTSWTNVLRSTSAYVKLDGSGNASDQVGPSSPDYDYYTADATYPSADYNITVTFPAFAPGGGARMVGIIARYVDASNYYMCVIMDSGQTNDVRCYKVVAGTATKISGAEDTNPTNGDVFQVVLSGSTIGLKKNGTFAINPITDTTFGSAGKAGYGVGDFGSETGMQTPGTGITITSFLVDYTPATSLHSLTLTGAGQ